MVQVRYSGDALWTRMERAVDKVRQRLERVVAALDRAEIRYSLVGGHAVRAWVAQVDESAVRTTRDIDVLITRESLPTVITVLQDAGFSHRRVAGIDLFLDGAEAKAGDAVHIVFAGEKVREQDDFPNPSLNEQTQVGHLRVISLDALVRMKLMAFRLKDQMHLVDMIQVGLVDQTWTQRLPPLLAVRLESVLREAGQ